MLWVQAHETYITMNQRTLATLGRTLVLGLDQDVYHTAPAEPRRPPGLDSRGQSSSEIPKCVSPFWNSVVADLIDWRLH